MVKTIFIFILSISFNLLFLKLEGQVNLIGIKSGFSRSDVKSNMINFPALNYVNIKNETRKSNQFGISYDYLFKNNINLEIEVNYNQRGISSFVINNSVAFYFDKGVFLNGLTNNAITFQKFNHRPITTRNDIGFWNTNSFN